MKSFQIREIKQEDNTSVAEIIRSVMTEVECVGDGYSINDPEVDTMFENYDNNKSVFYVVEEEKSKKLLGCGGIGPLVDGMENTCELKKMYFKSELRGHGMGQRLLEICLGAALDIGYQKCYLETTERMKAANGLYTKNGFKALAQAEGNTGHCGCDAFYIKDLKANTPFDHILKT